MIEEDEATEVPLDFYMKDTQGMFLSAFWYAGNKDLKIEIEPRDNVQSGRWYTATWINAKGGQRYITAQWHKLVWERIVKQAIADGGM